MLAQTYTDWELCLADGSDSSHDDVRELCMRYAHSDKRIIYRKLDRNFGIAGNTNSAVDMATGDYLAPLDHDDLLHPSALYEVVKAICEQNADVIYTDEASFEGQLDNILNIHLKPDFAPDTLRSHNYICHFSVFEKKLADSIGRYQSAFDGSQDYDMTLRFTEKAKKIVHVQKVLYFWRMHKTSVAKNLDAKPYAIDAGRKALEAHLARCGLRASVEHITRPGAYRMRYEITGSPLVSIIIPNKDSKNILSQCIESIIRKSTYTNYEIIVVENNSTSAETFAHYKELEAYPNIRVVVWDKGFNYPAINNFAVGHARGEHLLLLNNDTEVITPGWMEEMLMYSQRPDVGAVGAMLYYPDDTVQHAGVIVGLGGIAGHSHKHFKRGASGYMGRMRVVQNLSAVTGACMMLRRDVYDELGGLDERYAVAFNDVDLCMRIRKAGKLIVFTPFAELYHYESKTRGYEDTPGKRERFRREIDLFRERWKNELEKGDPYYHPYLTQSHENFSIAGETNRNQ